jgi:DNA-binding MarR family transcriptional regulator
MKAAVASRKPFDPFGVAAGTNEPLVLLHFAFRAVVAEPDARLAELGLGRVHHRALFFIARTPGLRVMDLLATLNVSKQALHLPLKELVRQKLVQSRAEPGNRRERRLRLTAAGRALERRLSGQQRRAFAAAFRKAGPGAARGWRSVMRALIEAGTGLESLGR